MIGLLILAVVFAYIYLSKFVVKKVYEKYETKKAKYIAIAIMILIPTWDILLGYPIYKVLCLTNAGVHIYKTVDNVEGFYVGEKDRAHEPYEPYKGYKYIDYKEMNYSRPTGKYYRSYWVNYWEDINASKLCVQPNPKYPYDDYVKIFKTGKCIVKEEMLENDVSRWKFERHKIGSELSMPIFNINRVVSFKLINRENKVILGELIKYSWGGGWVRDSLRYFIRIAGFGCSGIGKTKYEDLYIKILKPKKGN